jgi:arylsulfatase A-like enzyme
MSDRPNIVIILADHVAFSGHYGNDRFPYRWPHLEKIAAKGAWCESAYAITPVCTPSRASFLTGKRPDKHGMRWNSEYPIPYNRQEFREDEVMHSIWRTPVTITTILESGIVGSIRLPKTMA